MVKRRVALVVAGLCLALAFAALGRWQLGREAWKRDLLAQAEAALQAPPSELAEALAAPQPWPVRVRGEGHFLDAPVLWLGGARDTLVPIEALRAVAARHPAMRLQEFAAAGHAPFVSHPVEFVGAVQEFLS